MRTMTNMTEEMAQEMFGMSLETFSQFLSAASMTVKVTNTPKLLVKLLSAAPGNMEEKLVLMFLIATGIARTQVMEHLDELNELKKTITTTPEKSIIN